MQVASGERLMHEARSGVTTHDSRADLADGRQSSLINLRRYPFD